MIKKVLVTLIIGVILFVGCTNDKEDQLTSVIDCTSVNASFAADVLPIIQTVCQGCHGAGSTNGPGELTNYTQISNAAARIKTAVVTGFMPRVGSLSAGQIRLISCWVDSGAPNN